MNTKIVQSIVILFVCVAAGASAVMAQGRYANVYTRVDVDTFIQNLETSSDAFSRDFKSTGGTRSNERRIVDRFENAVDQLRRRFNANRTWWASRSAVQSIMNEAQQVNIMMNNDRFARSLERQWRDLRRDINKLADTYELPELPGGRGGGAYQPIGVGGGRSRPPAWAVGTWYWVQGPDRQFTIDATGGVTEYTGGRTSYGTYNRGSIFLNGNQSSVTRTSNGIRTYNTATGESSDYTRNNTGPGPGWGGEGNMSRPPSWAVGTWRWVQGYGREFTIDATGRVTENLNGQVNYGTYYNGVIMLNGNSSTVTRTRNGIRTYNQTTGETSDYVRR